MFLIQILLPVSAASCDRDEIRAAFAVTREELVTANASRRTSSTSAPWQWSSSIPALGDERRVARRAKRWRQRLDSTRSATLGVEGKWSITCQPVFAAEADGG